MNFTKLLETDLTKKKGFKMFKKLIIRNKIKQRKKQNKKPLMSEIEEKYINIALDLIKDTGSKLFMCPMTNRRFIRKDDIFMTLRGTSGVLNIINGIYHYEITLSIEQEKYLVNFFNKTVHRRVNQIEKDITSKVTSRLDIIRNEIKYTNKYILIEKIKK